MKHLALLAALALTGCFMGSEFHEATDDEVREALAACGFTGVEPNPPGAPLRVRFDEDAPDYRPKRACFDKYVEDRDWLVTR